MSISPADTRMLKIAYQTFVTKEFALKLFSNKHSKAGFEGWVVGELLVQFEIRGLNPIKMTDPDMVANGIKIELKAAANSKKSRSAHWLITDYEEHPIYDRLHLFVFSYNKSILRHLIYFLLKNNIAAQLRKLRARTLSISVEVEENITISLSHLRSFPSCCGQHREYKKYTKKER